MDPDAFFTTPHVPHAHAPGSGASGGSGGVSAALLHSGSAGLALVTPGLSGLNSSALTDELRLSGPSSQAPPPLPPVQSGHVSSIPPY